MADKIIIQNPPKQKRGCLYWMSVILVGIILLWVIFWMGSCMYAISEMDNIETDFDYTMAETTCLQIHWDAMDGTAQHREQLIRDCVKRQMENRR